MQEINQGFNLSQKGSRIPPNSRAPFPEGGADNDGLPEFLAAQQGQVGFINQVVKVPFEDQKTPRAQEEPMRAVSVME